MDARLDWCDEYAVGVDDIDRHHRELFRLVNEFRDAFQQYDHKTDILWVLRQLVVYAEAHFRHEEDLMARAAYPLLGPHCEIHRQLLQRLSTLQDKCASGETRVDWDTVEFLKHWLTAHILTEDKKFGAFLRGE